MAQVLKTVTPRATLVPCKEANNVCPAVLFALFSIYMAALSQ